MDMSMNIIAIIISAVFAYLVGNVQMSILISHAKHDDIRTHGSGNAGSTNMVRVYGLKYGLITLFGDIAKSFIAVSVAKWAIPLLPNVTAPYADLCIYIAGLFTVLGHNFPVFFGFRGGKGVATSLASVWAVFGMCNGDWIIPILTTVLGVGLIVVTGIVSLGSLFGTAVSFLSALLVYAPQNNISACLLAFSIFTLIFLRHTKNIVRIIHGEEKKLFKSKKDKAEKSSTTDSVQAEQNETEHASQSNQLSK